MDLIELGSIVEETKGGVGCYFEALNCGVFSGQR